MAVAAKLTPPPGAAWAAQRGQLHSLPDTQSPGLALSHAPGTVPEATLLPHTGAASAGDSGLASRGCAAGLPASGQPALLQRRCLTIHVTGNHGAGRAQGTPRHRGESWREEPGPALQRKEPMSGAAMPPRSEASLGPSAERASEPV